MKLLKLLLCLGIILFASSAGAEIYKYLDENGNIHFTDDFSKVPVEQRSAVDVSVEYVDNTNHEPITKSEGSDETNEGISNESVETAEGFADDSADTQDKENFAVLDQNQQDEADFSASSDEDSAKNDFDDILNQLNLMKKEIDSEYQALVKEKEKLDLEKKSIKGQDEVLKHNKKVEHLNKMVEAYANKGKLYESRVEAFNEWVRLENAKLKKKSETP